MIRIFSISVLAAASLASLVAHADPDSYNDAQKSRQERNRLYPGPVRTVSQRVAFIQAITGSRVLKNSVRVGHGASACDGSAQTFVSATIADGRVCTSPAPTSCDARTVSCE